MNGSKRIAHVALLEEALHLDRRRRRLAGSRRRLRTAPIERHHVHEQQARAT